MPKNTAPSTQKNLPIAGIQDSVIIMNDASVRSVIKVEPINFELKSETEQNAIIYSYQAFLNSLEFPIQIVIHSKKLDLERYLVRLENNQKNLTNDLLRLQIEDYVEFVRRLISVANIMSKRFYLIVNYAGIISKRSPITLGNLFAKQASGPLLYEDQFSRYRTEINNRVNIIAGGLSRIGLKVSQLNTQELIELFYSIYNPDLANEERLTNVEDLDNSLISGNELSTPPIETVSTTDQAPAPEATPTNPANLEKTDKPII